MVGRIEYVYGHRQAKVRERQPGTEFDDIASEHASDHELLQRRGVVARHERRDHGKGFDEVNAAERGVRMVLRFLECVEVADKTFPIQAVLPCMLGALLPVGYASVAVEPAEIRLRVQSGFRNLVDPCLASAKHEATRPLTRELVVAISADENRASARDR